MIKLDIVYGHSITQLHGVNYVTDMFVQGKEILLENDISLQFIYHDKGRIDCTKIETIFDVKEAKCKVSKVSLRSRLISFAKSKNFLFEFIRFYIRNFVPAKKTIKHYLYHNDSDCVIFQDFITAYLYFKKKNINHNKAVLIMHTSGNFLDLLRMDKPTLYKNFFFRRHYIKMFEVAAKNIAKLVILSEVASKSFHWIEENKKVIIYNGLKDCPSQHSSLSSYDNEKIKIVSVGHLIKRKGQHLIIEAISRLKSESRRKISLFLVGEGIDRSYYEFLISKFNLQDTVYLLGQRKDVPTLLKDMDIFILASYSEGLPISIIEALRAGLYIMTTSVGGCPELIKPDFGKFIDTDAEQIAEALELLIDKGIPESSSVKAKQFFHNHFTLKMMMINYAKVIKEIL